MHKPMYESVGMNFKLVRGSFVPFTYLSIALDRRVIQDSTFA